MSLPIKISLYGMDDRSQKMMALFFRGACKSRAVIVKEHEADVDFIDADLVSSVAALEQRINQYPSRPVIMISLNEIELDNIICLQKPLQAENMLNAIARVSELLDVESENRTFPELKINDLQSNKIAEVQEKLANQDDLNQEKIGFSEYKKTNKYKTALLLSEQNFTDFIGFLPDLDFQDRAQWPAAKYQPHNNFLSCLQVAINKSKLENKALKLSFDDFSLALLPRTNEVWFDTDDKQLKALANLDVEQAENLKPNLTALTPDDSINKGIKNAMDKFWDMDALVWKIACWTSKGRFPATMDYEQPVFLSSWPNFTRLLITPHALRISALLIERPRTLANIVDVLNIKPQYVFVFISAASVLGLAGQAERNADVLIEPPEMKKNNRRMLLNQLVHKLIGN